MIKHSSFRPATHFIAPYQFVLKEGSQIQNDFLDYSLLLLQVGLSDTLHSPKNPQMSSPIPAR